MRRQHGSTGPARPTRPSARSGRCGSTRRPRHRTPRGQATVELALLLPLILMVLLVVLQVGVLARDRLAVVHATRAAARTVIVDPSPEAATRSLRAQGGAAARGRVAVSGALRPGGLATVTVTMAATPVPIIGHVVAGVTLRERLTVYVEGPG